MVKVGFVAEGECDTFVLESNNFRKLAESLDIYVCPEIINAHGEGNLRYLNLIDFVNLCYDQAETPDKIIVLSDLETDPCVTEVKKRINPSGMADKIIVARKALESWFLADHEGLSRYLGKEFPIVEFPEQTQVMPWDELRQRTISVNKRGIGQLKKAFAKKFVKTQEHFSLERAAQHPNCPSALYFLTALQDLQV